MGEAIKEQQPDDKPPFLGSWKNIYWLLMITLSVLVFLFYLFTQYFS